MKFSNLIKSVPSFQLRAALAANQTCVLSELHDKQARQRHKLHLLMSSKCLSDDNLLQVGLGKKPAAVPPVICKFNLQNKVNDEIRSLYNNIDRSRQCYGTGVVLSLPPSTGKTLLGLSQIVDHYNLCISEHFSKPGSCLIVVPAICIDVWLTEIFTNTNFPEHFVHVVRSSNHEFRIERGRPGLYIISYDMLR